MQRQTAPQAPRRARALRTALLASLLWMALAMLGATCGLAQEASRQAGAPYPPVLPGHVLEFPRDFGAHPAFRTEWWYITGWLRDEAGDERGFQLTFFRVRTRIGEDNPSRFAPRQLILAHAAIADPRDGRLRHAERSARAYPGLAGAAEGRTAVEVDGWFLHGADSIAAPYRSAIRAEDFAFELEFTPPGAPVLNGRAGFSQKAPDALNSSYYYSRPQLAVRGRLEIDDRSHAVQGSAWLDHEWSSEILPQDASGWDWMGINLHDGGSLMLFQMRDHGGKALWAAGTLVDGKGGRRVFAPEAVRFSAQQHWRSPRTGKDYPVRWRVRLLDETGKARELEVRALMDDQELDSSASTGAVYWEGAVRLFELGTPGEGEGKVAEREIGRGYFEMTGYGERLNM